MSDFKKRINDITQMLSNRTVCFGRPVTDRNSWNRLSKHPVLRTAVEKARELAERPLPELTEKLYLDFSRNGNRTKWEHIDRQRKKRITAFTLAECCENEGRFLNSLEECITSIASQRLWIMPSHDKQLKNFNGDQIDIDLGAAMLAWELSTADYLLACKLDPAVRRLIRERIEERVFDPFRAMATGRRKPNWWFYTHNNWNAVCLAGVTGSALALLGSKKNRAFFVAAAEKYIQNFLQGFTSDGYCTEGIGYWNYGFGYFILLSEAILNATEGELNLLQLPEAKEPALFGARMEIINSVYPSFSDCPVGKEASPEMLYFISRFYGLGLRRWDNLDPVRADLLVPAMMYSFPNSASKSPPARERKAEGLRTWFPEAGALITRPFEVTGKSIAAAIKGGNNAEHHNHNDIGSFIVVKGSESVLADPGSEVYTRRTFSPRRYESKVLNSYGHSVPLVDGRLQQHGREASGKVLASDFSNNEDRLVMDLTQAYHAPHLRSLRRTFVYRRKEPASITVKDEVEFSEPAKFGTALITLGEWKYPSNGIVNVLSNKEALQIEIDTADREYDLEEELIDENVKTDRKPVRLGINLKEPVMKGAITLRIKSLTVRAKIKKE